MYERIEVARSYFNPARGETNSQRIQRLKRLVALGQIDEPEFLPNHWARGVWEGHIDRSPSTEGPNRTMVIVTVKRDGVAVGGWSYTEDGKFGLGAKIKVNGEQISVTTLPGSHVELRRTGPDQLRGTFTTSSRKFKAGIVLNRK
jgi:hypothetical protein